METEKYLKVRSMTACMKTAYEMMTSNAKALVRKTWITHVPLAILLAVVLYFLLPDKTLHDWGADNPWASFIVQTIVYVATIAMVFISMIFTIPVHSLHHEGEKKSKIKTIGRILRHFGGFLTTILLGTLVVCIIACIAALPSFVLMTVQIQSQIGGLEGDPLGVPAYFTPLLIIIFTLSWLIIVYAADWIVFSLAYQYGSYKVMDEEKERQKNEIIKD